jgi:glutamyl-tRNA synthetase
MSNLQNPTSKIQVRFPPSPTGSMHVGTARALLFNFLFARSQNGKIIFRSEDTDRERSKSEFEQEILNGLKWLGLNFDQGPFHQSKRLAIYEKYFTKLKTSEKIYPCFCSPTDLEKERNEQKQKKLPPKYSGKCRELSIEKIEKLIQDDKKPVWRFRVPDSEISFTDLVRKRVAEHGKNIADFIIRKADGQFLYHFCVVVDDIEMQITHVIRGEDHLSNTSKHILLFKALDTPLPQFAHLPLLLNRDRSKMSKRDETGKPATIARLQQDGYLPEAVVNFLALLGWNPGDTREFFTLQELIENFQINKIQKAGAVFDLERLNFFNSNYIRKLSIKELAEKIKPFLDFKISNEEKFLSAVKLIQKRLKFLAESSQLLKFFFHEPSFEKELFVNEKMKVDFAMSKLALENSLVALRKLKNWTEPEIQKTLLQVVEKLQVKNGQVLWPVRVALTGEKFSPGVWEVAGVLGFEEVIKRIENGVDKLKIND